MVAEGCEKGGGLLSDVLFVAILPPIILATGACGDGRDPLEGCFWCCAIVGRVGYDIYTQLNSRGEEKSHGERERERGGNRFTFGCPVVMGAIGATGFLCPGGARLFEELGNCGREWTEDC